MEVFSDQGSSAWIVPLRPPPAHLYSEATITRFQAGMRTVFTTGAPGMAKSYLRFLIERIVVNENDIEIVGRTDRTLAAMAAAGSGPSLSVNLDASVLASGSGWLQRVDSNQGPGEKVRL